MEESSRLCRVRRPKEDQQEDAASLDFGALGGSSEGMCYADTRP